MTCLWTHLYLFQTAVYACTQDIISCHDQPCKVDIILAVSTTAQCFAMDDLVIQSVTLLISNGDAESSLISDSNYDIVKGLSHLVNRSPFP